MSERCLVVKRELLERYGVLAAPGQSRFTPMEDGLWEGLNTLVSEHGEIRERKGGDNVEEDLSYKQIIPYACVTEGSRVLVYTRGGEGMTNEPRLWGNASVGIGGHMDAGEGIMETLYREFIEEARIVSAKTGEEVGFIAGSGPDMGRFIGMMGPEPIGIIDSEAKGVSMVHLGVAMRMRVPEGYRVEMRSSEDYGFEYVELGDYIRRKARGEIALEDWSRIMMDNIVLR